jgi:hypothetical protein
MVYVFQMIDLLTVIVSNSLVKSNFYHFNNIDTVFQQAPAISCFLIDLYSSEKVETD